MGSLKSMGPGIIVPLPSPPLGGPVQEHWITRNSYAGVDPSKHEKVIPKKRARIVQQLASEGVRWQEDKYAPNLQFFNKLIYIQAILHAIDNI